MVSVGLPPPPREASHPAGQPAATAIGQLPAGGGLAGDVGARGPEANQSGGRTNPAYIPNQPEIVDLDRRS